MPYALPLDGFAATTPMASSPSPSPPCPQYPRCPPLRIRTRPLQAPTGSTLVLVPILYWLTISILCLAPWRERTRWRTGVSRTTVRESSENLKYAGDDWTGNYIHDPHRIYECNLYTIYQFLAHNWSYYLTYMVVVYAPKNPVLGLVRYAVRHPYLANNTIFRKQTHKTDDSKWFSLYLVIKALNSSYSVNSVANHLSRRPTLSRYHDISAGQSTIGICFGDRVLFT